MAEGTTNDPFSVPNPKLSMPASMTTKNTFFFITTSFKYKHPHFMQNKMLI